MIRHILNALIHCSRGHGMFDSRLGPCPVCKRAVYMPKV